MAATALVLGLGGCQLGQPHSFTARTEKNCAAVVRSLTAHIPVTDPVAYTVDRFGALDRLLVTVTTDRGFPGGTDGADLHADWVVPARAALKAGRPSLDSLREIPATSAAARARAFRIAVRVGDAGVRTATLRRLGLVQCATLYTLPTPGLAS